MTDRAGAGEHRSVASAFDPWTATREEARAAQVGCNDLGAGPLMQWIFARKLMAKRELIEVDGGAVMDAVADCATVGLAMPDWLARAFLKRYDAVARARAISWDDSAAFGLPWPKGIHLAAVRRRQRNAIAIANLVTQFVLENPTEPLDAHWEEWGRLVGEGRTRAQEAYSAAVRAGIATDHKILRATLQSPDAPAISRKLAGRRRHR